MRIGMFTDTWLPTRDGCVTSIQRFKESLELLGHNVFLFAPEDKSGEAPKDDKTFFFKARAFAQYPEYRMAIMPAKGKNELIKEHDIEILHNHGLAFMGVKAMFSSRQLKIPILLHFHTWVTDAAHYYPFNLREDFLVRMTWRYLKSLCLRSDGVVAPSQTAINELRERVPGMKYTDSVAPGIDFERFNPNVKGNWVREKHEIGDSEFLLHVGRVSKEKNLEVVFDALSILKKHKPNAKLVVVGTGPALEYYKALAKQKGLENSVIFTGFILDGDLPAYYNACDTFVLASKFETLGIVMTEALACGKPVVGINYRVVPEVIKDGYNGYVFQDSPQAARECAGKLLTVLNAPPESMKRNAIASVQHFDTMECARKLVEIYAKVIDVKDDRSLQKWFGGRKSPEATGSP